MERIKNKIKKALENVIIGSKNIVKLGYIKKINFCKNSKKFIIDIILPNPTLHFRDKIINYIYDTIKNNIEENICIKINIIKFDVNKKKSIKYILAIASGKGGVGKSTIASNISVILSNIGYKVGLLDADIYGPSIPTMFGINSSFISISSNNGLINPICKYGIKIISIGFFSKYGKAIVWRGPMASKALIQFINEINWGNLDFLIIDLPPGTGDIHLSILQEISLTGAIIVSTSQKVAIDDVIRTIEMFKIKSIYVPIIGIIENMSFFIPTNEKENKTKYFLFGKDGVKNISKKMNIFFLGEIPILKKIQIFSDLGIPAVMKDVEVKNTFIKIAKNIINNIIN